MKFLLLILSFFFNYELQGQSCIQHNQSSFSHQLQQIDYTSQRRYSVVEPKNQVRIVIIPHGQDEQAQCLAAATYRILHEQSFDKIIIIHQHVNSHMFYGVALPHTLDDALLKKSNIIEQLSQHRLFRYYQEPFCENLGMQLQFAFLNYYIKNKPVCIPLIIGAISRNDACEIAAILVDYCTPETLIILSSDIAAYQDVIDDCPFDQSKNCKIYDQDITRIQAIQSASLQEQVAAFNDTSQSSAFAVLFELLQLSHFKKLESDFVGYATSYGCANKYKEDIQTYGAFIFQHNEFGYKNHIGSYEQLQLLQHAREGLCNLFQAPICRLPSMISYEMSRAHGVFVSLYAMSDHGIILRGCMGKIQSKTPLWDMVYQMAQQAACYDMRFYALQHKDLENTIVSISIITDFKNISHYDDIQQLDGIVLQYDDKEAILLPTKIVTAHWDYKPLLINLSQQIGLHDFIWQKPRAKIFTFRSVIFQEE